MDEGHPWVVRVEFRPNGPMLEAWVLKGDTDEGGLVIGSLARAIAADKAAFDIWAELMRVAVVHILEEMNPGITIRSVRVDS